MTRSIAIAMFLLVAFAVDSFAQSSQETPRQNTQAGQQKPDVEQRKPDQSPAAVKTIQPEQAEKKATASTDNRIERGLDGWTLSDKIALIASIAALLQFLALIATVWVMVRNGRRQLRAYISGFQARLTNFNTAGPTVEIIIKNSGQTPAYQVHQISTVTFSSYPRIEPLELVEGKNAIMKNLGVVGSGAHFSILTHLDHPPLSAQQKTLIGTKKAAIYAHGRIEYIDAFNHPRWAIYRYVYGGDEDPHPDGDLALCNEGNDAD